MNADSTTEEKIVFYTNLVEEHESLIPKHISGISFKLANYAATKYLNIHGHWPIGYMDQIYQFQPFMNEQFDEIMQQEHDHFVEEHIDYQHAVYMLELLEVPDDSENISNYKKCIDGFMKCVKNSQP